MRRQLEITSIVGQAAIFLLVAFFLERLASLHLGEIWGALLTVGVMLAILAGVVLWKRRKREE